MLLALVTALAVSPDLGPVDAFVRAEMERQKVREGPLDRLSRHTP